MKKIYALTLVPILCFGIGPIFANRASPMIMGLPFLLFWIFISVILTSLSLGLIYKLDNVNRRK